MYVQKDHDVAPFHELNADDINRNGDSGEILSGSTPMATQSSRARGVRRLKSASLMNSKSLHRNGSFKGNAAPLQRPSNLAAGSSAGVRRVLPDRSCSARSLRSNDIHQLGSPAAKGIDLQTTAPCRVASGPRNRVVMRTSSSSNYGNNAPGTLSRSRIAPPSRGLSASASSGGLRPFNRDQIVNMQTERKINTRGAGASTGTALQRQVSGDLSDSNGHSGYDETMHSVTSGEDFSLFTMDSIHLRKGQQIIADPLDDKSYMYSGGLYEDECSFADHESCVTRSTNDELCIVEAIHQPNHGTYHNRSKTVLTFGNGTTSDPRQFTERLNQITITETTGNDDHSCYSMASGLTNDFADFAFEDDDDEDCYGNDDNDDEIVEELEDSTDDDEIDHRRRLKDVISEAE